MTSIQEANVTTHKRTPFTTNGIQFTSKVGSYSLSPMPGNTQIGISHGTWINYGIRGKGYGKLQHKERLEEAYKLGHRALLCTVNPENAAEKHILAINGWKKIQDICWCPIDNKWVELWFRQLGELTHTHIETIPSCPSK